MGLIPFFQANDIFTAAVDAVAKRYDAAARRLAVQAAAAYTACGRQDRAEVCEREIERRIADRDAMAEWHRGQIAKFGNDWIRGDENG